MTQDLHPLSRYPHASGLLVGLLPLPVHLLLPSLWSHQLAAITLILIAGIYIGYGFKDGRPKALATELLTALGFTAAAWFGMLGYPWVIALALAMYGVWDVLHHSLIDTEIPRWYIPFCATVDWVMAACLMAIWYGLA